MNPNIWRKNDAVSHIIILCAILIIAGLAISGGVGGPYFPSHFLFGLGFILFGYGLGIREKHFLVNRAMVFIGQISFSMYLIHFFVLDMFTKFFLHKLTSLLPSSIVLVIVFLSTLLVAIVLSYLLYKIIELPGIKLGRKISTKMKDRNH